jgi:molecular chaperone GrpE
MSDQATTDLAARVELLQTTVAALEKQISRAGREQLKANALAERQAEQLAAALAALQAAEERRAGELESAHAQRRSAVAEARLEFARAIFPTLDGLDEALRAGQAMLAYADRREPPAVLLQRLLFGEKTREESRTSELHVTLAPWLEGLSMVRRRLLDTLAAEGVAPIATEGQPFDPRLHVAVEVLATGPPGTVIHELRRGFVAGERILRPAEVAVAGAK